MFVGNRSNVRVSCSIASTGLSEIKASPQHDHTIKSIFREEFFFVTSSRSCDVDGWPNSTIGKVAAEYKLHVAGSLEFLKDHVVHTAAGFDQGCRDDGD